MKNRHHNDAVLERAISNFFAVRGAVRTRLAQGYRFDPISWLRVEAVKFIAERDCPTLHELAEYLSITAPSASALVNRLVADGLVARTKDTQDRRSVRLTLTSTGKHELAKKMRHGMKLLGELFSGLSRKELMAFAGILERILTRAHECYSDAHGSGPAETARRNKGARARQ